MRLLLRAFLCGLLEASSLLINQRAMLIDRHRHMGTTPCEGDPYQTGRHQR
jgi:hypothetical protein